MAANTENPLLAELAQLVPAESKEGELDFTLAERFLEEQTELGLAYVNLVTQLAKQEQDVDEDGYCLQSSFKHGKSATSLVQGLLEHGSMSITVENPDEYTVVACHWGLEDEEKERLLAEEMDIKEFSQRFPLKGQAEIRLYSGQIDGQDVLKLIVDTGEIGEMRPIFEEIVQTFDFPVLITDSQSKNLRRDGESGESITITNETYQQLQADQT